ncbi:MAG: hypothetical protein ACKOC5_09220 [Chloroflexota bacterium]
MEIISGLIAAVILLVLLGILYEYRIRQPDVLVLFEKQGRLALRSGPVYPRHFSLPIKRTTHPIAVTVQATASGNLGLKARLAGSVAPAPDNLEALVRVGGWNSAAVERAAAETCILVEVLVKEHTEHADIQEISSSSIVKFVEARAGQFKEKFGVELVSLAVQSLAATEAEIAEALRQQEQARLLEETERLNNQARVSAARAKYQADETIAEMDQALELKKTALKKALLEEEAALARLRVEDELQRSRLRLAFEREELAILKDNPELLVLTPQAARLAEASQGLKNARTIITLSPQDAASGGDLLALLQNLLQKALDAKKNE